MSAARLGRMAVSLASTASFSRAGSSVTRSTGARPSIHTSAARPPWRMAIAAVSGEAPTRAKPPGITVQPERVRMAKARSVTGRGSSRPSA